MNKPPPPLISIRKAQPQDVIQLLRIQADALRTLCSQDYAPEQIEALINRNIRYASRGGSQRETTLVAEVKGMRVGLATLLGSHVSALYVHPHYARQGIGSRLLKALEKIAVNHKVKALGVAASLTARPFYQANGYQVLGTSYITTELGLRIQYIEMRKHLRSTSEAL
ncbi:GNAT family N-acetyltransferase [Almyronema epifaneia]|uniref:GNAT family N-acetyltransferase n=1 Tax=Almyronema epifaneia S1 TaxID=2991925 RepID=A0ABW6ICV3_9CYAN